MTQVSMPRPQIHERQAGGMPGLPALGLALLVIAGAGLLIAAQISVTTTVIGGVIAAIALFCTRGLTMVAPGQAQVLQLFGRYQGTIRADGLRWVNPFTVRRPISTR